MKQKNKIEVLLLFTFIISSSLFLGGELGNNLSTDKILDSPNYDIKFKTAAFWSNCPPIHILNNNWSAKYFDWIQVRTGTLGDPHLIENVTINAGGSGFCILIENSSDYFEINNCTLLGSSETYPGLMLNNVTNGKITNSTVFSNPRYGIFLYKSDNNTIQKNKIFNNEVGIRVENCNYNNFSENQIHHNFHRGFELEFYCENNIIFNNTIENNGQSGLWANEFCTMNNIKKNNITNHGNYGISFQDNCNHNNISQNLLVNNTRGIYFVKSTNNTLTANEMIDCGLSFSGDSPDHFDYNIDTSNTVNGNSVYYYFNESNLNNQDFTPTGPPEPPGQIILAGCNDSLISDFNIFSSSIGISLHFCENVTIRNNTLNNNREYGIDLTNCYNITVSSNEINNSNFFGIKIRSTTFSKIIENNVSYNEVGLHLRDCFNNNITKNRVKFNNKDLRSYEYAMAGIVLQNCDNNTLLENTLSNNTRSGVYLLESNYNNITKNIVTNNSDGIYLSHSDYNLILNNTMNNNTIHQDLEDPHEYGNGIFLEHSNNNNLTKNKVKYNEKAGIYLFQVINITIKENNLTHCGLYIYFDVNKDNPTPPLNNISYDIDDTNNVNSKSLIYRWNELGINFNLISDAGQIILINCNNSIISNTNITHATVGITLYNCSNNIITNNSASFNNDEGLLLNFYCHNNSILKNNFSNCRSGISVSNSDNSTISQCDFKDNLIGLLLSNNINTTIITNNTGINNAGGAIFVFPEGFAENIKLSGNDFRGGGIVLLYTDIQEDTFNVDDTNTVNEKKFYYYYSQPNLTPSDFSDAGQIYLINTTNSFISDLDLSNASVGLCLYKCNNTYIERINFSNNYFFGFLIFDSIKCNFSNCIINNNQNGMFSMLANNINFFYNEFNNNNIGIYMQNSSNNILYNNSFNLNEISDKSLNFINLDGCGLYISNSSNDNIIYNNTIENNDKYGIYLGKYSNNNSIQNNRIIDNKEFGIFIPRKSFTEDNRIYHNNFINNYIDALDSSINNTWDDGYAGNYWDDYKGEDINPKDGIGDSPFLINGTTGAFDTNPLMYPTYEDTDGDGLNNYEEYILGLDGYITNVTNPDTDYDFLRDGYEYGNNTNPLLPDTDGDNLLDGEELLGILEYITNATNPDTDYDFLRDDYEYGNNTNPLLPDTDFDTIWDIDEIMGIFGYITNATNPDTDYDFLRDDYEYGNNTNPLLPDTDGDNLLDGEELLGILEYITNATNPDTDYDFLRDDYEYGNNTNPLLPDTDGDNLLDGEELLGIFGYITNATNPDTDYDSFKDDIEINRKTNPLNRFWYPMPNLKISGFSVSTIYEGENFVLNFTIMNDGLWDAEGIIILIQCEALNLSLYDNFDELPFNLEVNQSKVFLIDCSEISKSGIYVLTLILDPENLINETYSSQDGGPRSDWENDNTKQIQMQIIARTRTDGFDIKLLIWIIIGVVAVISIISIISILRPRIKKRAVHKRHLQTVINVIENFESNLKMFIKLKLQDNYSSEWWDRGIPEYIRATLDIKMQTIKPSKQKAKMDPMDALDLPDCSSIITNNENWEQIFSTIFPNKSMVETNLMNLSIFKKGINQGIITSEQLSAYPLFINNIRSYFTQELNVFLSYSTLDTKHFNIKEIARRLETYPKIDKVFFWEEDSGENIVTYMERTLKMTKVFVFFCSQHSVKSRAVEDEWQAAFQMRKKGLMKIVPVYENEELIPFLLTPLLNVKFTKDDFDEFIQKLYEEIIR